jgi:glycosyltransferase involved in cell wall biosynthesis
VGQSTLQQELPWIEKFLVRPDVHLGIDPEFSMKKGGIPGRRVGTYDAADINYASRFLAGLVTRHKLPPKILVVHRFTPRGVTNAAKIALDPRVQVVMHMDGWGPKRLKEDSYERYIVREPVQFTGFKLFYGNDTKKKGSRLMTPDEVLALCPRPLYIQYQ